MKPRCPITYNTSHSTVLEFCTEHGLPRCYCSVFANGPNSQIPQCTSPLSHNASFCNRNVHKCAHFCYKMVHCTIRDLCIVGYLQQAYFKYQQFESTSTKPNQTKHHTFLTFITSTFSLTINAIPIDVLTAISNGVSYRFPCVWLKIEWVSSPTFNMNIAWRHQMKTVSLLLAFCEANPSVTNGFPLCYVYIELRPTKDRFTSWKIFWISWTREQSLNFYRQIAS